MSNTEKKKSIDSNIKSAFLKGNTKEHLMLFYKNPPKHATFERQYRLLPAPFEVNLYDSSSLFAGKIHAVICRSWKNRVKGRDLYDYVFYLARRTPVNINHLRERLIQTGYISEEDTCSLEDVKKFLNTRFETIDYEQAKEDVLPFIRDHNSLNLWSVDFFKQVTNGLIEAS